MNVLTQSISANHRLAYSLTVDKSPIPIPSTLIQNALPNVPDVAKFVTFSAMLNVGAPSNPRDWMLDARHDLLGLILPH